MGKFPCYFFFSMVAVPPSLFVLLVCVPGNHVPCNVEGFTKISWEPSEEGTIERGMYAGYAFILWVGTLCLPVLFLLSKVIVLFIPLFSCHLLWGLGGIEVEKKKVQRYIQELVPCFVVFFCFATFYFFLLLFSIFI
jgi:hypothetical protein